jgi:hypothetical protein
MKIYQIITEDYDNFTSLRDPEPSEKDSGKSNKDGGEKSSDQPDNSVVGKATQVAKNVAGYMPDIGVDLGTLALAGISVGVVAKLSSAALSKTSRSYADKLKLSDRVTRMWKTRYGPWSKLFSALGIAVAITQLYEQLYVLEAMYVQGKLEHEKFVEQREFEFGIFTTQILTPTLVTWIGRAVTSLTGVKWAIRLLGGVSVGATLGASVAATIASEVFIRWFQYWLGTENGKNVLYKYFGGIIRTIGKPADSLWDVIMNAYQGVSGKAPTTVPGSYNQADVKKYGSQDAATAAQADRKAKADALGNNNLTGLTPKTGFITDPAVDKAGKIINPLTKIVVTDKDGNLLSNAALMSNPQLNLIRTQAVNKGQPDPLEKFAKSGQRLPAIL